ncbi:MAG TPA: pyridoxal phosphate-dependent aminotransferase family protein [Thermoguttaceae bacterium]|nr:pyridoxal phosphate-dependent aminotransferase family protein [Thermoguttaceae bacterium]
MPLMQSPPGAYTVIDGRRYLYFAGTGYLGLQGHPEVIRAACEATQQYGIGSANSRTAFGNLPPTLDVEHEAAAMLGVEDAFYFASGYVGNHILTLMLQDRFDAVFVDELSHYSVFEAARLSGRPVFRFRHCDPEHLAESLEIHLEPGQRPLVAGDGVFAARGTIAPVAQYEAVLAEYPGAMLCLDDAHGLGVLGMEGRGTFEHAGLFDRGVNGYPDVSADSSDGPRLFLCGTLSKAIGGHGGVISGSGDFIARLKSTSPYYGGASAPPVPAAAATARALEIVRTHPELRTRLWKNAEALKGGLCRMGLQADDTPVPIVCLTLGDAENMQRIQRELMQRGIVIAYMAAYSGLGPEGALRLAVFATHTEEMIGQLLDELRRLV